MSDRIVFATFAETVRYSPMRKAVADPTRPAIDIRAILHQPEMAGVVPFGNGFSMSIVASSHALVINREAYPGLDFAVGDKVRATNRPGTPWFVVSKVNSRHPGIIVLELGEA